MAATESGKRVFNAPSAGAEARYAPCGRCGPRGRSGPPQGNALAEGPAAFSRFGLDHHFARSVVQHADADVIVGQAGFELFGDSREHLVGMRVAMAFREMVLSSERCRALVRSSLNSRAFSMAILASLARTRRSSSALRQNTRSWSEYTAIAPMA